MTVVVFFTVIFVGASYEKVHVDNAPSTLYFYTTPKVCSVSSQGNVRNRETAAEAKNKGDKVMHCGKCGACSNKVDIDLYEKTKGTLKD